MYISIVDVASYRRAAILLQVSDSPNMYLQKMARMDSDLSRFIKL